VHKLIKIKVFMMCIHKSIKLLLTSNSSAFFCLQAWTRCNNSTVLYELARSQNFHWLIGDIQPEYVEQKRWKHVILCVPPLMFISWIILLQVHITSHPISSKFIVLLLLCRHTLLLFPSISCLWSIFLLLGCDTPSIVFK